MADMVIREGDVGVTMTIDVGEDISDASTTEIILQSPTGTRKTVVASAVAETAVYITEASVFDELGRWLGQVHVVQASKDRLSSPFGVVVERAL